MIDGVSVLTIPGCDDFKGSSITSEGGLIPVRELDERLSFGDLIAEHFWHFGVRVT